MTMDELEPRLRRLEEHPLLLLQSRAAFWISMVLWAFGGLLFVLMAIPPLADVVQIVDDAVFDLVVRWEYGFTVGFAKALDFVGSTFVATPIMIGIGVLLAFRRRWETFWFWVIAMAASQVLIGPVKALYERPRPPMSLVSTSGYSFPSGHAVAGAAIAVALVIVLVPAGPRRRSYEILAAVFAFTMVLSRVYLRAHWLSDAAAGAALGAAVVIACAALVEWLDRRRHAG